MLGPQALSEEVAILERFAEAGDAATLLEQLRRIEPTVRSDGAAGLKTGVEVERIPDPIPTASGVVCPQCSLPGPHHTGARTYRAPVRRHFTSARPQPCHDCGWRGWVELLEGPAPEHDVGFQAENPDFGLLDAGGRFPFNT